LGLTPSASARRARNATLAFANILFLSQSLDNLDGIPIAGSSPVKTTAIYGLIGALLGIVLASLLVPPALSWYSAPGGLPQGTQIQAIVQIPEVIRYATSKLIRWQMISAVIGGVLGLVAGVMLTRNSPAGDLRRMGTTAPIPGR
jgi:hypothetical protein